MIISIKDYWLNIKQEFYLKKEKQVILLKSLKKL